MSNDTDRERERLSQRKMIGWLNRDMPLAEMVAVYWSARTENHNYGIYCALIPTAQIQDSLSDPCWDLMHGHGLPATVESYENEQKTVKYCRYGSRCGIEPLVIDREFYGIRPNYKEISEEFRLFHRLYHDCKDDHYYKINDAGNEELAAIVEPQRIQIRLKEIRQFLAVKEMHLAILFDCREHSSHSLEDLRPQERAGHQRNGLLCSAVHYGEFSGIGSDRAFSRLLGKRLIPPLPKGKSGFWGFSAEEPKKHVDFIIGIDENGYEIAHTSNPDCLTNYFEANPGAPHYLTPVHFRKQVLDKYYQQPGRFSVADGILRCGGLWSMTIDNHHDDRVVAWLGDLGRDLPYEEQLNWRSQNLPPTGGVSETFFKRQILAEFADSDRPEHVFHERYHALTEACRECLGWSLLLPLTAEDEHHFQCLRVPSTDEQKEFDELVQSLTKILIDSLNEKALNGLIPTEKLSQIKGSISRLEFALRERRVPGFEPQIAFLRKLQDLRSSGAAHRKGSDYLKIAEEFHVDSQSLRTVFSGTLGKALDVLDFLISAVRSGALGPDRGATNAGDSL